MTQGENARIKYALYSPTWDPEKDSIEELRSTASRVLPLDFAESMLGDLYCPGCSTGLTRTPREKSFFSNGRRACFAHLPSNRGVPCDLRSGKPLGLLFQSEEEAAMAIESEELVVISSFMGDKPESPAQVGVYVQTPVEDILGPHADVPISRHSGKTFKLPTKVATVAAICRRFDINLYRYYFLPGAKSAVRLMDALKPISAISEEVEKPALYFGKIVRSFNAGRTPKPSNIRMTQLECHQDVKDFYIKVVDSEQFEKGITDESLGRYVVFWGGIEVSGIGLCAKRLKWGEFALLPQKYEALLPHEE